MGPRGWVDPVAEKKGAILGLDAGLSTLKLKWVKTSVKTGKKCLISASEN
jgi:capsid protein